MGIVTEGHIEDVSMRIEEIETDMQITAEELVSLRADLAQVWEKISQIQDGQKGQKGDT